ncbi:hypothetical protein [Nonomuraea sp. B5E05]|uniref:hypothetical protein n=1 Tax=Nonomuraea sp. B5E05 TaxID=3153569 RepID=UPI003260B7A6
MARAGAAGKSGGGKHRNGTWPSTSCACFTCSYGDEGIRSVAFSFHNHCEHSRGIKVRVAHAVDDCG